MNREDYRNTTYCKKLEEISKKKSELKKIIRKNGHPRAKDFHKIIKEEYRDNYFKIYNYKCSYCGASIFTLGTFHMFEIDHYINKASFSTASEAGGLENLVLSCYTCNRSKSELNISKKNLDNLQPDNEEIKKIFYRDEEYGIKINHDYEEEPEILTFYKTLKFNYEFRKIDFLLLNLEGLYETLEDGYLKTKVGEIKEKIKEKRSLINTMKK